MSVIRLVLPSNVNHSLLITSIPRFVSVVICVRRIVLPMLLSELHANLILYFRRNVSSAVCVCRVVNSKQSLYVNLVNYGTEKSNINDRQSFDYSAFRNNHIGGSSRNRNRYTHPLSYRSK